MTDNDCAIRIPPTTPEEVVRKMAAAIVRLAESPELRKKMGENAHRRILDHFLWSHKGIFMTRLISRLEMGKTSQ